MAQDYVLPLGSDTEAVALGTRVPGCLEALRTFFAGATAPTVPVPYQAWLDTSTGWLKVRNSANTAWLKVARAATDDVMPLPVENWFVASLSATRGPHKLAMAPRAGTVKRLVIYCETASSSSSGNEWQFALTKRTNSTPGSTVALFSGTVGTFTSLGGVGGGAEFVAHKAFVLTPNQNADLGDLDVLELTITKVGTATTLVNVRVGVDFE